MVIKKFRHSCLLLEEKESRLLIDPGSYSFGEGKFSPEEVGPVDAILLTHKHADHYDPTIVRAFAEMQDTVIITHEEIGALLAEEGMEYERVTAGEIVEYADFSIKAFPARHGPLPIQVPHNLAYFINETVFHPGDSISFEAPLGMPVLALPVTAPWMSLVDAVEVGRKLAPKHVIPVHDAIYVEPMRKRVYEMCAPVFKKSEVDFHPLEDGDSLEIEAHIS